MPILITGGAGFIGSHFARRMVQKGERVVVLDKLTYAGNPENLKPITQNPELAARFKFYKGDICDRALVDHVMSAEGVKVVVNFAAESHVDRSILSAESFIDTDIKGAYVLLDAARKSRVDRFVQISTDEVYGSIERGSFRETDPLNPRNPYSASKAGADRLAYSFWATYGLPVIITRSSNNYGPNQYPEKFIPLFTTNAIDGKKLPLYGDGRQVRDWLHVDDNCEAIEFLMAKGELGDVYNVGGGNERENVEVARLILDELKKPASLIEHVRDREGHDRRYSLDCAKLERLGWRPKTPFEAGVRSTVRWYAENEAWWRPLQDGSYADFYKRQYGERLAKRRDAEAAQVG